MVIDKVGSQADIAHTLLKQMHVDTQDDYPWSKDLLSPHVPEFALLATTRGFGWVTPQGKFTFHLDYQRYIVNSFEQEVLVNERKRCDRSEEHTSELQSRPHLVCRLLLEKKKKKIN